MVYLQIFWIAKVLKMPELTYNVGFPHFLLARAS